MIEALLAVPTGLGVSQIASFDTTIYLHRCQTHGAVELHPAVDVAFRAVNWITTGQRRKEWVGVHRKHHARSDEEGDPHSPEKFGFWTVQLKNFLLYKKVANDPDTIATYARDIEEDWWDRKFFNHGKVGLSIGIGILWLLLGPVWGSVAALVHVLCYVGVLTSCVNALGHHAIKASWIPNWFKGYQNYGPERKAEKTFNYQWLAWLTAGEGLHNNHHGDPASGKLAHVPGEIDPAFPVIQWLVKHGLASNLKMPRTEPVEV